MIWVREAKPDEPGNKKPSKKEIMGGGEWWWGFSPHYKNFGSRRRCISPIRVELLHVE